MNSLASRELHFIRSADHSGFWEIFLLSLEHLYNHTDKRPELIEAHLMLAINLEPSTVAFYSSSETAFRRNLRAGVAEELLVDEPRARTRCRCDRELSLINSVP